VLHIADEDPGMISGSSSGDAIAAGDQEAEGGRITASITWITPFDVRMSVVTTFDVPLSTTPPSTTAAAGLVGASLAGS
jgi:hypothetical protein